MAYLYGTKEMGPKYGCCRGDRGPDGNLPFARSIKRLEMYADISFAPLGEKSHQGVLGFYGGALVQWESNRQSFATLSTAEAELVGYIEAMIMGDSLCAVLDIMEGDGNNGEGITEKVIYGDNTAALAIVQNPDGPWRTRHLRLRANVLRERVRRRRMAGSTSARL